MRTTEGKLHHKRVAYALGVIVCLSVAYFTGSNAIDTANLWVYALTLLLVVVSIKLFFKVVGRSHES